MSSGEIRDNTTDVCPRCHGSPVTVTGTPPNHVITICEACIGTADLTPVDMLGAEIAAILQVCQRLQADNLALQQELAEVVGWPLADRQRVQAALGATIGMKTAALQSGKVWELVDIVIRLLCLANGKVQRGCCEDGGCNCWICAFEKLIIQLVGWETFPASYRRFQK